MKLAAGPLARGGGGRPDLGGLRESMIGLLARSIQFESPSGQEGPFTRFLAERAEELGLSVDLWGGDEAAAKALGVPISRHIPLEGRPTLVVALRGCGGGRSLLFNAHSDVVAAGRGWSVPAWEGRISGGRLYGRGACDTKGPLIAALWAMAALGQMGDAVGGDVLLEVVPGEEDCVGLGTLTSVARGYRADAAVVLEPTQNVPRCASRGGCRFELTVTGRAVHGTCKWLGVDSIGLMRRVLDACAAVESGWGGHEHTPMAAFPIAHPITVDSVHGEGGNGMICDHCTAQGYLELLPEDDIEESKRIFEERLRAESAGRGVPVGALGLRFTEQYFGHTLRDDEELCRAAVRAYRGAGRGTEAAPRWPGWTGFNSGCEAGIRQKVHGTPTLVWGPGDLGLAHAPDESIGLDELHMGAARFAALALDWCSQRRLP